MLGSHQPWERSAVSEIKNIITKTNDFIIFTSPQTN